MRITLSMTVALITTSSACGAFSGPYAPANWTFSQNGGNGAFVNGGGALTLVGSDDGSGVSTDTDYTIMAAASGTWSFHWSFSSIDTGTLDSGGYLLNGVYTVLAFTVGGAGNVSVPVNAGHLIGYRVHTVDNFFGPGVLTISGFEAPVPGPAAAAALAIGGLLSGTRRRRAG